MSLSQEETVGTTEGGESEMPPGAALWQYLPVDDPADRHEDAWQSPRTAPLRGWHLVGARVRGRKHKHEGTNCDDWFELAQADPWSLIAVSDGAGSYRLSRVGARVSTRAAIEHLRRSLAGVALDPGGDWSLGCDATGAFERADLERVRQTLHDTMVLAHHAVVEEARRRGVAAQDLSGTLRLAAHTTVRQGGRDLSFVLAVSVGDGMTAAIADSGELRLLGREESGGKYSGETEFLADPRTVERARLAGATYTFLGPLRTLLVMSDGVADPYFPSPEGMPRLYADLLLNGVIRPGAGLDAAIAAELARRNLDPRRFSYTVDSPVGPGERLRTRIRQADRLAQEAAIPLGELLRWPPLLLLAGSRGAPITEPPPAGPCPPYLRLWLDAFYVRGEFDDRTLVVLHREPAP